MVADWLPLAHCYSSSADRRARFQLLDDQLVELGAGVLGGHAQGVLDGPVAGAAVADDADAVDAQQRRAAVRAVVVAVDQRLQGLLRLVALRVEGAEQLLGGHLHDELEDALADLEHHVADEAVGDDDVARALVDVAALDVADELLAAAGWR